MFTVFIAYLFGRDRGRIEQICADDDMVSDEEMALIIALSILAVIIVVLIAKIGVFNFFAMIGAICIGVAVAGRKA